MLWSVGVCYAVWLRIGEGRLSHPKPTPGAGIKRQISSPSKWDKCLAVPTKTATIFVIHGQRSSLSMFNLRDFHGASNAEGWTSVSGRRICLAHALSQKSALRASVSSCALLRRIRRSSHQRFQRPFAEGDTECTGERAVLKELFLWKGSFDRKDATRRRGIIRAFASRYNVSEL
jgi:hypothetical protein